MARINAPTVSVRFDLSEDARAKLEHLAVARGTSMKTVIQRLIEAASMPDASKGQRLCVCSGERVVTTIAI